MVVIKKRSNVIPIDFGEFQLEYRSNDESIKRLNQISKNIEQRGRQLQELDDEAALDALHAAVREGWVELFDKEAFEKVYAFSENTTVDAALYLVQTINGIISEINARNSAETLSKYLEK